MKDASAGGGAQVRRKGVCLVLSGPDALPTSSSIPFWLGKVRSCCPMWQLMTIATLFNRASGCPLVMSSLVYRRGEVMYGTSKVAGDDFEPM